MIYRILAEFVVIIHFSFVLFVLLGGLLVLKYWRCAWLHVPAILWAVLISFAGWDCPLTPLENGLRQQGGTAGYGNGFTEHYILPILYPTALTRNLQIALGLFVLMLNTAVYVFVILRYRRVRTS